MMFRVANLVVDWMKGGIAGILVVTVGMLQLDTTGIENGVL